MKTHRNVVAFLALLAVLQAPPAAADWTQPGGGSAPPDGDMGDMILAAQMGFQMLQVAL